MKFNESKYIKHLGHKIRTPFGFQTIEYVHKTIPLDCVRIIHEYGELTVAVSHTFIIQGEELTAEELRAGDYLETTKGKSKISSITSAGKMELYDISLDQEEFENYWYYSSGVLSHNSGKSITVACYLCWLFNFHKQMNIGIVANRGSQAKEFLRNTKDIYTRLPLWMANGVTEWNKQTIANELEMRILTDVPSGDAFRGFRISVVVVDECIHSREKITVRDKKSGEIFELSIGDFYENPKFELVGMEIPIKFTEQYEVLTSNGFQSFGGIKKVRNTGLEIKTQSKGIRVTRNHKFYEDGSFVVAGDLSVGDSLGGEIIKEIIPINDLDDYYDLLEVGGGNHYTTSSFESSNCAFIKPQAWEEFADSIFPSQASLAWKKNIIVSTAKGLNHFFEIVQRARASTQKAQLTGESDGTVLVEVDWREVPRFNADGTIKDPEDFRRGIIDKHGKAYFEQNFGNNFTGSAETLIDSEILDSLRYQREIEVWETSASYTNDQGVAKNSLRIFELPEPGHTYVMGVDAAKDGKDAFAVQILDITVFPFRQVASADIQINYLEMPEYVFNWAAEYNTAFVVVENNEGAGQSVVDTLAIHMEYPNIHYDDGKDYPGFRETVKSRGNIINMLKILGNKNKIVFNDFETIEQLRKFERINGKYEASSGHDDLVMALALTLSPLTNMDNFENFGAFINSLKSAETVDTSSFLTNLMDASFADI